MKAIQIYDLYKCFGQNVAVNGLRLDVEEGEIFGLLGPNGAGKSTTINILSDLVKKDKGEIKVFDKVLETHKTQIKQQLGVVPQELAIFEELTAYENVKFFGQLYGLKKQALEEASLRALEFVGLMDKAKSKAKSFSGGMKRRLNIACGIVHSPKLIIMDEPTVGIDPQSRNYILKAIQTLNKDGATIIYTTHYMQEAEQICTRIAIVDEGRVVAIGSADELKEIINEQTTVEVEVDDLLQVNETELKKIQGVEGVTFEGNKVIIGIKKEIQCIDKVMSVLIAEGAWIIGVTTKTPTLEDVFLNLTGKKLRD